jgi:hypothetical protein
LQRRKSTARGSSRTKSMCSVELLEKTAARRSRHHRRCCSSQVPPVARRWKAATCSALRSPATFVISSGLPGASNRTAGKRDMRGAHANGQLLGPKSVQLTPANFNRPAAVPCYARCAVCPLAPCLPSMRPLYAAISFCSPPASSSAMALRCGSASHAWNSSGPTSAGQRAGERVSGCVDEQTGRWVDMSVAHPIPFPTPPPPTHPPPQSATHPPARPPTSQPATHPPTQALLHELGGQPRLDHHAAILNKHLHAPLQGRAGRQSRQGKAGTQAGRPQAVPDALHRKVPNQQRCKLPGCAAVCSCPPGAGLSGDWRTAACPQRC